VANRTTSFGQQIPTPSSVILFKSFGYISPNLPIRHAYGAWTLDPPSFVCLASEFDDLRNIAAGPRPDPVDPDIGLAKSIGGCEMSRWRQLST
jgi:hypothetical protein